MHAPQFPRHVLQSFENGTVKPPLEIDRTAHIRGVAEALNFIPANFFLTRLFVPEHEDILLRGCEELRVAQLDYIIRYIPRVIRRK